MQDLRASESGPMTPTCLNAETKGIWSGWNLIGDKEVAREAATKGTHIQLALLFLKTRKNLDETEIQKWFNQEILDWISALLQRKQIFKASHILTNINLDPIEEITKIFINCKSGELRSYLGNHLLKIEKITAPLKENWLLLNKIEEADNILSDNKTKTYLNIACMQNMKHEEKEEIVAKIYAKSFDEDLIFLLHPLPLWKSLLDTDNINFILAWINRVYSKTNNDMLSKSINDLFVAFPITFRMINFIRQSQISDSNKMLILNEFCKYGIFQDDEQNHVTDIVRRMCDIKELTNINSILQNSSVININQFYRLLVFYCLENKFYELLGFSVDNFNNLGNIQHEFMSIHFDAVMEFKNMFNNLDDVDILRKNIFNIAQLVSENLGLYFENTPLILLALITLTKDVDMVSILKSNATICICNFNIPVNIILDNYPVINNIIRKMAILNYKCDISQYDLIDKYHELNIKDVLKFRFENDIAVPNFNCPILVKKYGYNKKIQYLTYIKYGRPIMATNFCNINPQNSYSKNKIQKLAFQNFFNPLIVSSCIVFIECMGGNSDFLRCHISAAKIILDNELETVDELIFLLENINEHYRNFLLLLETSIMKQIKFNIKSAGAEVINAIQQYSIVVQFTILHHLSLPLKFLKYCAQNNLWLPFLMHLQKYHYPIEVAQKAIQCCRNETLLEHMQHCLLYDVQAEKKKTPKSRDSRSFYLSRIGMRKNVKEDSQTTSADGLLQSSITSQSSYGSATSSSGLSDFIESETLDLKSSLLQTIIKCHNSTDPPRALLQACQYYNYPLFAILATSYEPDSVVKNWLTWLTVSCGIHKQFIIYDKVTTSASLVTDILQTTVKNGYCKTLEQSLQIFLADNPLKIFVIFLNECLNLHFDENILKECLNSFKSSIKFKRSNSIISENDHEMTYLNNKLWVEHTAITLLATMLQFAFQAKYEQLKLLQFLNVINFKEYFVGNVPDFFKLLQVANILIKTNVSLNFSVIYEPNSYRKEVISILEHLINSNYFVEALDIAKIENYEVDKILIKRLKYEHENQNNSNFWEYCNQEFNKHKMTAKDIVAFYMHFYSKSASYQEQISLLLLSQQWAANYNLENLYDIEKNLWITYFKEPEISKNFKLNMTFTYITYKDMLTKLDGYETVSINLENITNNDQSEVVIFKLLNAGDIFQALRFQRIFDYKNADLEILKLCMSVAEGLVLPYQLNAEQRLLIMKGNNVMSLNHRRRAFLSTRLSSVSSSSHSPYGYNQRPSPLTEPLMLNTSVQDAIAILESLIDRVKAGSDFAQRILMLYRISANIDRDYKTIICIKESEASFGLLRTALSEDCRNKLEVVHDCVQAYKWTREQISDFLCEEIITCLTTQVKLKTDIYLLWDLQMDKDFQMILQLLLDNCTMLGHKLYSYASAVHHSETATSAIFRQEEFSLVIELLIRAHDCYTADCNMEGISVILKKCRALIGYMLTKECWRLIVRLLTGVARYTEMNYVFQILREHDQFEFLLRKGSRKDNGLKLALLEYLKKYCPENRELYRMVALHFTLFSEVAELWENEADGIIRNLIAISKLEMQNQRLNPDTEPFVLFTNTDGTKLCLNKAMVNYTHAAEYHLQGEKLSKAMKAAKQAQLLALQLSLLKNIPTNGTTICLLYLSRDQINRILTLELSFPQGIILIEGYNHNVDWATVLFQQFIVDNKQTYFDSFMHTIPLTDAFVHNLSRRFLSDRSLPDTATANMKIVLRNVTSVGVKYKIASELVFTDILEELLAGDQLAYLKDTVWIKGYKE